MNNCFEIFRLSFLFKCFQHALPHQSHNFIDISLSISLFIPIYAPNRKWLSYTFQQLVVSMFYPMYNQKLIQQSSEAQRNFYFNWNPCVIYANSIKQQLILLRSTTHTQTHTLSGQ